jgi:parvulin-like peptidyl-prolyl isomerase
MRTLPTVVVISLAAAFVAGAAAPGRAEVVDKIVAVVNDDIILQSQLDARIGPYLDDVRKQPTPDEQESKLKEVRLDLLDRLIDDSLIAQQATELKVTVTDDEVQKAIADIETQNKISHDQLVSALESQGYAYDAYKEDIQHQILRLRVVNIVVRARITISDEEVKRYYDENVASSGQDKQVHLRHILIAVPPGSTDTVVSDKRKVASDILDQARAKPDSFPELARSYSDDEATKTKDGDLGWISPGMLEDALEDAVFVQGQPGDIRGPILTGRGFEVVQILEVKQTPVKSFDDAKDEIRQKLYEEALDRETKLWLADLRKKASIDIRI